MHKIIFTLLLAVFLTCGTVQPVTADPQASMQKISDGIVSMKGSQDVPVIPLTDQEIKELSDFIQKKYKSTGKEISELQAALMAGVIGGITGVQQTFKEAFEGSAKAPQKTQPSEGESIFTWPSGVVQYAPKSIMGMFEKNQFSAEKEMNGKEVIINGYIDKVEESSYSPTGKIGEGNKLPKLVFSGLFHGFITKTDNFDPSKVEPGYRAILLCKNIRYAKLWTEGLCRPVGIGPVNKQNSIDPVFFDKELYDNLQSPKK